MEIFGAILEGDEEISVSFKEEEMKDIKTRGSLIKKAEHKIQLTYGRYMSSKVVVKDLICLQGSMK